MAWEMQHHHHHKQNHHARNAGGPTPLHVPPLEDFLHHSCGNPVTLGLFSVGGTVPSLSGFCAPVNSQVEEGIGPTRSHKMSRKNGKAKMDLKVNTSLRTRGGPSTRPANDDENDEVSPPSSCVSSEEEQRLSNSPETTSMVLAGCPRCLMYVMLSEEDPKCPKCKSTVLLDFQQGNNTNKGKSRKKS